MISTFLQPPVYLITDRHQAPGASLQSVIAASLQAGIRLVQLREKDLPLRELVSLARAIRAETIRADARLLINDRMDVCIAVEADGVHLRSDSLPTSVVRKILGPDKIIGVSTHSGEEALKAEREGASFITIGPIYETASKSGYGPPLGPGIIRDARARVSLPIFALGGIKLRHISEVFDAGASGIAVISSIIAAKDPKRAARDLIREATRHFG